MIPPGVVTGDALDVLLRTPDAVSAAELGVDDDDRRLSVFLRRLELWSPPLCEAGVSHELGEGAMDERMSRRGGG